MYKDRIQLLKRLEEERSSKVLVYVTGDRQRRETQIAPEVQDFFVHHLDRIGDPRKISLYLYTRGGMTLAAWSLANLIRQFCKELEVIVPSKAHSAGTLICLAANKIIMTKQATLGPIDPSVNNPLNPVIPGAPPESRVLVSVEDINGFTEFSKSILGEKADFTEALVQLTEHVHPLVLGNAFRARSQIRMLGRKLMMNLELDDEGIEKILKFLCSESGSHDYTINRKEAKEELKLPIEKPNDYLYHLIKSIHDDIAAELELNNPFDPKVALGTEQQKPYRHPRALIESVGGGSDIFITEGILSRTQVKLPPGIIQDAIQDNATFEGWRHEDLS
jgi:hypothetical protein